MTNHPMMAAPYPGTCCCCLETEFKAGDPVALVNDYPDLVCAQCITNCRALSAEEM